MASCRSVLSLFVLVIAAAIGGILYVTRDQKSVVPAELLQDHYWGPKDWRLGDALPKDDEAIKAFRINFPDEELQDLKQRLSKARIQPSIPGVNFEYGFHSDQLKQIVNYWSTKYDWRKEEKKLNQYNHFKTQIEGLDVHFIHVKPKQSAAGGKAVPLLLVHGWPGSVLEYYKAIPLLTEGSGVNFELVIPSIPGYGFSQASQKPGLNLAHVSRIFVKLMRRLGHEKFLYQGGDWGSGIGSIMAAAFPKHMIGYHTNFPMIPMTARDWIKVILVDFGFPGLVYENESEIRRTNPLLSKLGFALKETGYMHIQSTKPDTVGAGLNDSPVGLAAYILEKFSTWTNPAFADLPDGGLTKKFTLDELLTNVMIYWINGNIASSQRFYKESFRSLIQLTPTEVPFAALVGEHEIAFSTPKSILKGKVNLTQYMDARNAGHFLPMEEPAVLADSIRQFYAKLSRAKEA